MQITEVVPGKKVQLEVHADDAATLRAKGMDFFEAMQGKTVIPEGMVLFGNVPLMVKATKPKGPVEVSSKTAIKMSITKKPLLLSCPQCGQSQTMPGDTCSGCGAELPVVSL